ncbi:hypothetical protein DM02DRAFT_651144 [Periconia macrospinosa]|uniref:Uncharacterized protein n=1 Tax=Periconia macrospinosa TaxID=97972 RepID=A0A2V1E5M3_9PLEO|nr:hypothetical protein DM02DRAFT_651144 [Periconia macrospinosa]
MSTKRKRSETSEEGFTLQEIMQIFWIIINTAIEHYGKSSLIRIVNSGRLDRERSSSVPVFTIITNGNKPEKVTATPPTHMTDNFGEREAQRLYTAFKNLNMCDWSVMSSLAPVKDKLAELGAEAEWISVSARKAFLMHAEEEDVEDADNIAHSVLLISDADGKQYIADFTMEQFGWSSDDFFQPQNVYFQRFADSHDWEIASGSWTEDPKQPEERAYVRFVRDLCGTVDWEKLAGQDEKTRLNRLQDEIAQTLKKYINDKREHAPPDEAEGEDGEKGAKLKSKRRKKRRRVS